MPKAQMWDLWGKDAKVGWKRIDISLPLSVATTLIKANVSTTMTEFGLRLCKDA